MPYVFTNEINEITRIIHKDEIASETDKQIGKYFNTIPDPIQQVGKQPVLILGTDGTLSYNYVDRKLTTEEQLTDLQSQNAQMILALVQGGLM